MKKTTKIVIILSIIIGLIGVMVCAINPLPSKVTLNHSYYEIYLDRVTKLYATIEPKEVEFSKVSWSSSNESVATVDEYGYIKGVSLGEAIITAKTINNKTATCKIKVKPHRVSNVELDYGYYDIITIGETASFTATVSPEYATFKDVVWSSSNPSVVSVDQTGNITALSIGEADIIATADGVSAKHTITVKQDIEASAVQFTSYCSTLQPNETFQFECGLEPSNSTEKIVSWSSSDESVATVDANGNVTSVSPGFTTITATTNTDKSCSKEIEVYIKATSIRITGYEELALDDGVRAMNVFSSLQLSCIVNPTNATHNDIKWSVKAPVFFQDRVTITETGLLTINTNITVTVTAELDDCRTSIQIKATVLPPN